MLFPGYNVVLNEKLMESVDRPLTLYIPNIRNSVSMVIVYNNINVGARIFFVEYIKREYCKKHYVIR